MARHLYDIRTTAFIRILMDQGIYVGMMIAITGLFMAAAGWATLDSGVLSRWTGWIAWLSAVLCALSVPAMFAGSADASRFYNPGGWGPAIIANVPPPIWFLVAGIVLIRQSRPLDAAGGKVPSAS